MSEHWDPCPTCKGSGYVQRFNADLFDFHLGLEEEELCYCGGGVAHTFDLGWCER